MADFNIDHISDLLGEGFQLKTQPNGNIQVQLSDLGNMSDLDKCEKLIAAARMLFDQGIIPENKETRAQVVRLSWPTGRKDPQTQKEIWVPFPQLWINKPSEVVVKTTQNSEKVTALEKKVDSLADSMKVLANVLIAQNEQESNATQSKPAAKKAAPKKSTRKASTKAKVVTPPVAAPPEDTPPMLEESEGPPF